MEDSYRVLQRALREQKLFFRGGHMLLMRRVVNQAFIW